MKESLKNAQERFEQRVKASGQRRVNARFEWADLERLEYLTHHFGSEAQALREAVRIAYDLLQRQQRRLAARTDAS